MIELRTASALDIASAVRAGDIKAVEVLEHFLDRIEAVDGTVNAWVRVDADAARASAAAIDAAVSRGDDPGPLAGVPIGCKDVEDLTGFPTTYGSLVYVDAPPATADTTANARLRAAGVVPVGKTATAEFGTVAFCATKLHGVTRNPWKLDRTSGGSSGGSSAAVSAGMVPLATGGDGGGSIRIPASFCGLVGFKPTLGRIPLGPRQRDWSRTVHRGPIARTVADAAAYVDAASGPDPHDPTSYLHEVCLAGALDGVDLSGRRALWTASMGFGVADPGVVSTARKAFDLLTEVTGLVEVERDLDWPDPALAWMVHSGIDLAVGSLDYWPDRRDDLTGTTMLSLGALHDHLPVSQVVEATALREEFDRRAAAVFADVDFVVSPTTPIVAFDAQGPMPTEIAGHPVAATGVAAFTYPFNCTGHPAISVPAGLLEGLPVGLQITGRFGADASVIAAAAAFERAAPWPPAAPDPFPA